MTIEAIGIVVMLLAFLSMRRGTPAALDCFVASAVLGAASGILLTSLGGVGMQPAHCVLLFLVIPVSMASGPMAQALRSVAFPRPGFFLLLAVGYGAFSAIFCPRVFAGQTLINAIGTSSKGFTSYAVPLGPTSGNMTQTIYFILNLACFALASAWTGVPGGRAALLRGVFGFAIANVVFALADLASFWAGAAQLMDPVRNSGYVMQTGTVVLGLKRIAGSFSEASSFAYASLGIFAFMTTLWLRAIRPRLTGALALAHLVLLILSTSSTAYVSLPIAAMLLYAIEVKQFLQRRASAQSLLFLVLGPLAALVFILAIMLSSSFGRYIQQFLTLLIFDKEATDSGIERGSWNVFAWRNFVETYGFGAGLGSARASSFPIAVVANLGAFGGFCYAVFLAQVVAPSRFDTGVDREGAAVIEACRAACLSWIVAASVSGALVDLGLLFFVVAGLTDGLRVASVSRAGLWPAGPRFGFPRPPTAGLDRAPV